MKDRENAVGNAREKVGENLENKYAAARDAADRCGENEIVVSIVMPARNAAGTIRQAMESVFAQTYRKWELIIVDDGSADGTAETAARLGERRQSGGPEQAGEQWPDSGAEQAEERQQSGGPDRIRILRNERNRGAAEARNRGVRAARGNWIAFLDSDDLWHPEKLRMQMELARRRPDADIIYTGIAFMDASGRRLSWRQRVPETVNCGRLLRQNVIACSSVLLKRGTALRYPMAQDGAFGEMHEDYPVWLQILRDGGRAYGIDEPLLVYRLTAGSRSRDKRKAAVMTYRVYRHVGLGRLRAGYFFCWYVWKNLWKYGRLRRG